MQATYSNIDEARIDLLEKSKALRASFGALLGNKASTTEIKEIATTMTSMVDRVAAQQSFMLATQKSREEKVESLVAGVDLMTRTSETFNTTIVQEKELVREIEKKTDVALKAAEDNTRR